MQSVILLNADEDTVLNILDWKKAICLLYKGKVKVIKYSSQVIHTVNEAVRIPKIIKLIEMVNRVFRTIVPFSRNNLLIRDNYQCGYCLSNTKNLTIDHVVPRSKGGKTNFLNCVSACRKCNHLKANKTPEEAGLKLQKRLYHPTVKAFLDLKLKDFGVLQILTDFREGK